MIKKRHSEVNTSSTSHREFQRRKDKTGYKGPRNKNQKDQKIVHNYTTDRIVHLGILIDHFQISELIFKTRSTQDDFHVS
jgi:hypothetical protein